MSGGKRRNVIQQCDARVVAGVSLLVAIAVAIQSAVAHVSPTGSTGTDVVVVGLFAGFIAWAGASAPWWLITGFGGVATLISGPSWWTIAAVVASGIGLLLGTVKQSSPWLRSVASGLAVLALMRTDLDLLFGNTAFGASAIVVGATCVVFVVIAIGRRPRLIRRRVLWCGAAFLGLVVAAATGLVLVGLGARDDLAAGRNHLTDGLGELRSGETLAAAASLRSAAAELQRANDSIDAIWTQPSRLIPVVSQHRSVLVGILTEAASSASAAADALDVADIDSLRLVNGTLDVEALAILADPLSDLNDAVESMATVLADANSPWLIGTVQDELANALEEIEAAADQSRASASAALHGPALLGRDESRTYLVVFTSPGEARGQSGLMGNWAEIDITDGTIRQTDFGRTAELIRDLTVAGQDDLSPSALVLRASAEYFDRYGPFGAGTGDAGDDTRGGGGVQPKFWSNVTMSPDTPTVGSVMAQMYEGGGHGHVDGVFVMDPTALAALLRVAGPVTVEGIDTEISADSLEQYLLFDQYKLEENVRRDLLEAVAAITLEQFLSVSLPEPQELARVLGPAATEGHLVGWAERPDEQETLRLIGMAGQLPNPDGRDGLAIVTNNASGNKIDSFLERTVSYAAAYDESTGGVDAELVVTLHNAAPSTGYPDYVIGNIVGLPTGTNRTLLTVYTPLGVESATLDDEVIGVTSGTELGWNTVTMSIDLAAGETRTVRFDLSGAVSKSGYAFVWRAQPVANADVVTIDVRSGDQREVAFDGELIRLTILDRDGRRALR